MSEYYFEMAYKEAKKAYRLNEVPVGAVIVKNDRIISKAHNKRIKNNLVLSHAEVLCILKANKKLKDWRLNNCDLYVTLKPCEMCAKIINESRIRNVYYMLTKNEDSNTYSKTKYSEKCSNNIKIKLKKLMKNFFKNIR